MEQCVDKGNYEEWHEVIDAEIFHDLVGSAAHLAETVEDFRRRESL